MRAKNKTPVLSLVFYINPHPPKSTDLDTLFTYFLAIDAVRCVTPLKVIMNLFYHLYSTTIHHLRLDSNLDITIHELTLDHGT